MGFPWKSSVAAAATALTAAYVLSPASASSKYDSLPVNQQAFRLSNPAEAAILAGRRHAVECANLVGGGKVAAVYDSELTGRPGQFVFTAQTDNKGNLSFAYWMVPKDGRAGGNISSGASAEKVENLYRSGQLTAKRPGGDPIWKNTEAGASKVFFDSCGFGSK
jgi:hypothetical protein